MSKSLELIRHFETGNCYLGDIALDTIQELKDNAEMHQREEARDSQLKEIFAQFPEEDFLEDVISELQYARQLNKSEMIDCITQAIEKLREVQTSVTQACEYAYTLK